MGCKFKVSRTKVAHALLEAQGNAEPCQSSTQFHLDPQPSDTDTQQHGWWPSQLASALGHPLHGWTGQRRPCLLATISLGQARVASSGANDGADRGAARLEATSGAAGTAQPKPSGKRKTAPWLLATPLPSAFLRAQRLAQTILQYYKDKGETFPRPCPVCGECEFLEPCDAHPAIDHQKRSLTPSLGSDNKPQETGTPASVAGNALGVGGRVKWESRPLACEQCHRWWHLGCLGIHSLDELPTSPWFHSKECRHTYLALEADAEAGQLPAWELGMKPGAFSVEMMTDADHRSFVLGAFEGGRGDMSAVYDLLSKSFPSQSVLGYGAAGAEFAGGKYAMLLRSKGEPVAVATFDAYGPHAAQLHLLATAPEARGKGHARALLDVLEHRLSKVGVTRLIAQPRAALLDMFTGPLGWEVVHPADAMQIHAQIPIAFFDTALVEKQLL